MTMLPPLPLRLPVRPPGAVSLLLDGGLRLLGAEPAATALIAAEPQLIQIERGRLRLPDQQAALEDAAARLLTQAGAHSAGLALARAGRAPLTLKLALERLVDQRQPQLWLHLVDADAPRLDGAVLAGMFGLTATETRVALLLARGLAADEIAARLGVQDNTVRSHIKQLLAKSHARRQSQLVSWLWRSAAVVLTPPPGASIPDPLISGETRTNTPVRYPDG